MIYIYTVFLIPTLISTFFFAGKVIILSLKKVNPKWKIASNKSNELILGFYLFIQFSYCMHYFFPLNHKILFLWISLVFSISSYIAINNFDWIKNRVEIAKSFKNKKSLLIISLVLILYTKLLTLLGSPIEFGDSITTHIPLEKLIVGNSLIIGLGNLDPYMAYGTPIQLLSALTSISYQTIEIRFVSLLFISVLGVIVFLDTYRENFKKVTFEMIFVTVIFLLSVSILIIKPSFWLVTPNYDFPTLIIHSLTAYFSLKYANDPNRLNLLTLIILCSLLFEIRITSVFYSLILLYFTFGLGKNLINQGLIILRYSALLMLFALPASIERALLTGYPFYPSTLINFKFDWQLDSNLVYEKMILGAQYVAKIEISRGAFQSDSIIRLTLASFILFVLGYGIYNKLLKTDFKVGDYRQILIPNFAYLILWGLTAPVIRYAWGTLITLSTFAISAFILEIIKYIVTRIYKSKNT